VVEFSEATKEGDLGVVKEKGNTIRESWKREGTPQGKVCAPKITAERLAG